MFISTRSAVWMFKEFKKKLFRNFTFYLKKVLKVKVNVVFVGVHKAGPDT